MWWKLLSCCLCPALSRCCTSIPSPPAGCGLHPRLHAVICGAAQFNRTTFASPSHALVRGWGAYCIQEGFSPFTQVSRNPTRLWCSFAWAQAGREWAGLPGGQRKRWESAPEMFLPHLFSLMKRFSWLGLQVWTLPVILSQTVQECRCSLCCVRLWHHDWTDPIHSPCAVPIFGEFCHRVTNLKETIYMVWNISPCIGCFRNGAPFLSEVALQDAERTQASPSSFQGSNPSLFCWRGSSQVERDREALGASNNPYFSPDFKPKHLWMDISYESSPFTHCGPNLLKLSHSAVCPSLEPVPTRTGCILWLCRRMGPQREGSVLKGCSESLAEQTGQSQLLREQTSEQKCPWALPKWPMDPYACPSRAGHFSLSIHVKSEVKDWQGTAAKQSRGC